ncbi:P-loop NTPase [Marivita sp.]|uniref:tyrosine-protein kinase family protein n=1 Tax=Marivita sp. TaxID=2003365 RepID=UPI0025BFE5A2|nr:P-loop NTPase [Marivita sp.]
MTDQPKFQRRKRRGQGNSVDAPNIARPDPDTEALLAQKDALLQRKAERDAEDARRARHETDVTAEQQRAAKQKAERQRLAKAEASRQRDAGRKAEQARAEEFEAELRRLGQLEEEQVQEAERQRATELEAQKPRISKAPAASKTPLVLASPSVAQTRPEPVHDPEEAWRGLDRFEIDVKRLTKSNIVTALREDPAHTRFDILRTRMLQALVENGWKRVAITSPTKNCGKTFTAANLAVSLSRQENCRTVLLDLDMRSPSLHKIFGVRDTGSIGDMLRGQIAVERHLQGFAPNSISAGSHVALGFNGITEPYAAELLQDPSTSRALRDIETQLDPDVMLFDLPPALLNDDVIAMRPHIDALLIVAAGGLTKANDIKETERRLGETTPLLGVVLNKAEQNESSEYAY